MTRDSIPLMNQNLPDNEWTIRWNYKKADWTKYFNDKVWIILLT